MLLTNNLRKIVNSGIWISGLLICKNPFQKKSKLNRLLVVRTDGIGDFVLFIPALKYLREKFADFVIYMIVRDTVGDLAEDCPFVDKVFTYNDKKFRGNFFFKISFLMKIHKSKCSICLYPAYSRDRIGDEMVLWSAARQKMGWDPDSANMTKKEKVRGDRIYSKLFVSSLGLWEHELGKNRELLKQMKIETADLKPVFWPNRRATDNQSDVPNQSPDLPMIAILPGAAVPYRQWDIHNFVLLTKKLSEVREDYIFLLLGGEKEVPFIDPFMKIELDKRILNLFGKVKLKSLPAIFRKCKLAIGNDTGPMHIAIASGIPTLCVLGGGHFDRFMPYGDPKINKFVFKKMKCYRCNWNCIYPEIRCLTEIPVESVFEEAQKMLADPFD